MPDSGHEYSDEFVSFALARPAQFGVENFAGDPIVEQYFDTVLSGFSLDVEIYVSWECPADVVIVGLPVGNALIRSERLDTLLVEFYRLQQIQSLFDGVLAHDVVRSQVFRWMCECIIGYRNSTLAVDALLLRPPLPGLELGIWNPFRDETLNSIPFPERIALQCFSLGHELGHLAQARENDANLYDVIDGLPIMSHIDYEFRASGLSSDELDRLHEYWENRIDAAQLATEITADRFAFDTVAEYLHHAELGVPEESVRLALTSCEALTFLYHCKETCRLLARVAAGALDLDEYVEQQFLANCQWVARARAVARRAGITLTMLEGGSGTDDFNRNVDRIDALILRTGDARSRLATAMESCEESLLAKAQQYSQQDQGQDNLRQGLEDPDLRLELYYILIAFGCHGAVEVNSYLTAISQAIQRVRD
jgi:hypothetical protein